MSISLWIYLILGGGGVLGFKSRASHMLGKDSTTELSQPQIFLNHRILCIPWVLHFCFCFCFPAFVTGGSLWLGYSLFVDLWVKHDWLLPILKVVMSIGSDCHISHYWESPAVDSSSISSLESSKIPPCFSWLLCFLGVTPQKCLGSKCTQTS